MPDDDAAEAADELRWLSATIGDRAPLAGASDVAERHRAGADNLGDYLALRAHDLRPLQDRLARLGVSSLGRAEGHVRATLAAALRACEALAGRSPGPADTRGFEDGPARLDANASALLGPEPDGRPVRIMVTLPSSAADDGGALARRLVAAGMDCARINTAHDDPGAWRRMVTHVRAAAEDAGRPVRVFADLGGPKLRTGPLAAGPRVLRLQPTKDQVGRVVRPARAVLVAPGAAPAPGVRTGVGVPVEACVVTGLTDGDRLAVTDARGKRRELRVVATGEGHAVVEVDRTTFLFTDAVLRRHPRGARPPLTGRVGTLPATRPALHLHEGDTLVLTAEQAPAPATREPGAPARIGCTLPEVFEALSPDDRVELDDGAIGGEVVAVRGGEAEVRITRAGARGAKLRAGKGINLPDTELPVDALTVEDRAALDVVAGLVDGIGLSFVRRPGDVAALVEELDGRGARDVGVVLKIETPAAFAHLPDLLVAAMVRDRVGVMIARGDLAVEAGYERTAELQEEMLWACEAAHLPVIWATQVLEDLAKTGRPSRAEVTDAAMSTRAECVMLNKGPYVDEAVRALDDILRRMATHQHKKVALLRRLRSWTPPPAATTTGDRTLS